MIHNTGFALVDVASGQVILRNDTLAAASSHNSNAGIFTPNGFQFLMGNPLKILNVNRQGMITSSKDVDFNVVRSNPNGTVYFHTMNSAFISAKHKTAVVLDENYNLRVLDLQTGASKALNCAVNYFATANMSDGEDYLLLSNRDRFCGIDLKKKALMFNRALSETNTMFHLRSNTPSGPKTKKITSG